MIIMTGGREHPGVRIKCFPRLQIIKYSVASDHAVLAFDSCKVDAHGPADLPYLHGCTCLAERKRHIWTDRYAATNVPSDANGH